MLTPTRSLVTLQIPWQWHADGHMSMHWGWWTLWAFLFVALAWWALTPRGRGGARSAGDVQRESPEEILRRRFAAGEIDEGEFERRLRKLRSPDETS
ncbi:MAG: SHOCT domain-containing protein [Gemmatimonadota bacterium]